MATKKATTARTSKAAAPKATKSTRAKKTVSKPAASTSKAKAKDKPKAPGVIASIIEVLTKATKTKPVTKEQLLAQLVKRFPERTPEAMTRTINCQVPSRLLSDKGIKVQSTDKAPKGYWIA
ncbi:hypothetical protein [Roseimaritima ulvae]|uniref:Uncharacterized protein n=1 Tax=Roseimaritima ulvae TaxID=980254 RepID=A0A5B9QMT1_9BACT|nr:hypothetical protein [Roseimaritima ulvae]QEG39389.1 hypothetical protein UC8_13660 [Roseimaritima ulvae]